METDSSQIIEPPNRATIKNSFFNNSSIINQDMIANSFADEL
jgi:hypothetical protein